jgi:peptide deformylase
MCLRLPSQAVERFDQNLEDMFSDLEATMRAGPGGVGIAAPQIGENSRMIVIDCRASLRPCKNHGLLYMANPQIEAAEGETLGREGCLSVPDWVGMVPRDAEICVSFDDIHGVRQEITATGFEARVIQHEIDHLDGILFIDRVISSKSLVRRLHA